MSCVSPWPGDASGPPVCLLPIARLPAVPISLPGLGHGAVIYPAQAFH